MTNTTTKFNAKNGLSVGSPPIDIVTSTGDISMAGDITAHNITSTGTVTLSGSLRAPGTITADTSMTSPAFHGLADSASNLSAGSTMSIPYQSATGTTAYLAAGTAGYALTSQGAGLAPTWSFLNSLPVVAPGTSYTSGTSTSTNGSYSIAVPDTSADTGYLQGQQECLNYRIGQSGTYYIYFGGGGWHYSDYYIYKNGVYTGYYHGTPNQQVTYSGYNIPFNAGDTIQLFAASRRGSDYLYQSSGLLYIQANWITIYKGPQQLTRGTR